MRKLYKENLVSGMDKQRARQTDKVRERDRNTGGQKDRKTGRQSGSQAVGRTEG
jgi:hypothetical protein